MFFFLKLLLRFSYLFNIDMHQGGKKNVGKLYPIIDHNGEIATFSDIYLSSQTQMPYDKRKFLHMRNLQKSVVFYYLFKI